MSGSRKIVTLNKMRNREYWGYLWQRKGDLLFCGCIYVLLFLSVLATMYPLIFTVSASVSDPGAVMTGKMLLLPVDFTLDGYRYILQYQEIWLGYANSIFYTLVGTLMNMAATLPCAYALSHRKMLGRGILMKLLVFTMYFSGGMIPCYLNIVSLGLLNTRTVILLFGLVSTYNVIVARTFFSNSIPWELHEAATLDGATDFGTFWRVVLPLSKPIIAVLALYYAVGRWNSYFNEMLYLRDRQKYPLQAFLREILTLGKYQTQAMAEGGLTTEEMLQMVQAIDTANLIKYGVIVMSALPMMVLYPFLQKFFAKGVMIGAIKG